MNLSSPFIKRPVMTVIVMALILLMGAIAFKKTSRDGPPQRRLSRHHGPSFLCGRKS